MKQLMKYPPLSDDTDYSTLQYPYYASKKIDGIRGVVTPDGQFMSYTEKPFKTDMQRYFAPIIEACIENDVYIDFEVYGKGLTFQEITSYVAHPPKPMPLRLCVFDIINRDDWDSDEYTPFDDFEDTPDRIKKFYSERVAQYESFCQHIDKERNYLFPMPQHPIRNEQDLLDMITIARDKKWEGVMLKQFQSFYQHKRPTAKTGICYKIKFWDSVDGVIVDFKQATTIDANRAHLVGGNIAYNSKGQMLVDTIGSVGVRITSDCPYKDTIAYCSFTPTAYDLRQEMKNTTWDERNKWLNYHVEVEYQDCGSKKDGGTLRMPRILRLRPDLDENIFD
jgi:hypothetical protein